MKLVIFDLDGTIVNLSIDWSRVRGLIKKALKVDDPLVPLFPSIEKLTEANRVLREKVYQIIEEEELKAVNRIHSNPKLLNALRTLRESGCKLALVTLQGKRPTEFILERMGIRKYFDYVVTRGFSISREKQIEKVLRELNVLPKEAIMIGDRLSDKKAAEKCGCKSLLVDSPEDLLDLIIKGELSQYL